MNEALAPGLAVAVLTETDQSVWPYRRASDRPMTGYAFATLNDRELRIFVLMENGRTLQSRSMGDSFYYEGWLLTPGNPISLGAFNTGPGGEANAEARMMPVDPSVASIRGVRITAEPFGGSLAGYRPILQGELVWLTDLRGAARPEPTPAPEPSPGMGEVGEPRIEIGEPVFDPGQMGETGWPEPIPAPAMPVPEPGIPVPEQPEPRPVPGVPEPERPVRVLPGLSAAPDGWDAEFVMVKAMKPQQPPKPPRPDSGPTPPPQQPQEPPVRIGEPAVDLGQMRPKPAADAHGLARVSLVARHPMAPRGGGTGHLDYGAGRVTLNLRGLPSPPSLGRDSSTDRPFNAYRVWLVGQHTGARVPLGLCTRVWGENWRFESDPALPLSRYDAILITADDRSATALNPQAPQVLMGSYGGA